MKTIVHRLAAAWAGKRGYLLTEALVYISVVVLILGAASVAVYRCIDASLVLRRGAEDIAAALRAGELWRADVRAATMSAGPAGAPGGATLELKGRKGVVMYRFGDGVLDRRLGEGPWGAVLKNIKASEFHRDQRKEVIGWSWELELQPRTKGVVKGSRLPLLFTFLAAPTAGLAGASGVPSVEGGAELAVGENAISSRQGRD